MLVFARRIVHPLDVPVDHPHHINPRAPRWSAMFRDQQRFHRGLPFVRIVFGLGQLVMYVAASRRAPRSDRQTLIPRHEFAFAPNWWRNEGIWHGQQAF
jgi:hypothetical protein